jgi:tetratricopeptide (TPR) repeat protein
VVCAIGARVSDAGPPAVGAPLAPVAAYVGAKACAGCHAKEHDAWRGSHHALAMREADERTVLGDFAGATFSYAGITSRFFRRDKKFYVHTDGPDGALADYVRGGRRPEALAELARAAELAPDEPRYSYAYALGLDAAGERTKALRILADAHRRSTGDREILVALVDLSLAAGDAQASARWAQQLRDLDGLARRSGTMVQ